MENTFYVLITVSYSMENSLYDFIILRLAAWRIPFMFLSYIFVLENTFYVLTTVCLAARRIRFMSLSLCLTAWRIPFMSLSLSVLQHGEYVLCPYHCVSCSMENTFYVLITVSNSMENTLYVHITLCLAAWRIPFMSSS